MALINEENLDNQLQDIIIKANWKTKQDGDMPKEEAVAVSGEFDFTGLTLRDVLNMAVKPLIINRQRVERTLETIPTTFKCVVPKPGVKKVRKPKDIDINKLTDEQVLELLEKLNARLEQ